MSKMGLPGFCGRVRMTSEPTGYWELKAVAGAETGGIEMLYVPRFSRWITRSRTDFTPEG
jgi:hypothetical protein